MADIDNLREMAREVAIQARDQWVEEHGKDITTRVYKMLSDAERAIVPAVLGFEHDRFDKVWAVDHCNGRSGQSFIGQYIAEPAKAACEKIVSEALKDWEPPQELIQAFRNEMESSLRYKVLEAARRAATEKAAEIAKTVVDQVVQDS